MTKLLKRICRNYFREIREEEYNKALKDVMELLTSKDKIYTEPVTIIGDNALVKDCLFYDTSLRIEKGGEQW